jgi:hypothetical protein
VTTDDRFLDITTDLMHSATRLWQVSRVAAELGVTHPGVEEMAVLVAAVEGWLDYVEEQVRKKRAAT